ncbi:hypothetical protein D027_1615A, partial [Vibrio parahaemolyticus 861]
MARSPLMAFF